MLNQRIQELREIAEKSRYEIGLGYKEVANYCENNPKHKHLVLEWLNGIIKLNTEATAKINESQYTLAKYKPIFLKEGWSVIGLGNVVEGAKENQKYYPLYK